MKAADGDWTAIKHFKPADFGYDTILQGLEWRVVVLLDAIQRAMPAPVRVLTTYTTFGHAANSYHYQGLAADFQLTSPVQPFEQFVVLSSFREIGGLGWYPEWNTPGWHIDLRENSRQVRWVRSADHYHYGHHVFTRFMEVA